ncbi:hypothetical protein QOZ80_5AG0366760 [Eleusine coracana subsp. coracana]|nr:hypothetical protein QOZ80_5AG0366760 [Eleusine coracana subsp. coracana]
MTARIVGIALLLILVVGAELVTVPEARRIEGTSASGGAVTSDGDWAAVVVRRRPSKWNTRRVLGADKRTVPGGPDPQHH